MFIIDAIKRKKLEKKINQYRSEYKLDDDVTNKDVVIVGYGLTNEEFFLKLSRSGNHITTSLSYSDSENFFVCESKKSTNNDLSIKITVLEEGKTLKIFANGLFISGKDKKKYYGNVELLFQMKGKPYSHLYKGKTKELTEIVMNKDNYLELINSIKDDITQIGFLKGNISLANKKDIDISFVSAMYAGNINSSSLLFLLTRKNEILLIKDNDQFMFGYEDIAVSGPLTIKKYSLENNKLVITLNNNLTKSIYLKPNSREALISFEMEGNIKGKGILIK